MSHQDSSAFGIVVHAGAGSRLEDADGCEAAARAGLHAAESGADAMSAAVAAVVALEDDGRFNAGSGAIVGLDGATIEYDAAAMDSQGRLGAVACLQRVRNPVLVAQAVSRTPHWLLAGEGAERFARIAGFPEHEAIHERAVRRNRRLLEQLRGAQPARHGVDNESFRRWWNYSTAWPGSEPDEHHAACDTVGAVVRDGQGRFAVACSTGGSAPSLLGRVGDTPIVGSGFYAGPKGAVAATGVGEHIVRRLLSHAVYQWIEQGMPLPKALERGIDLFPDEIDVGLIAISRTEAGSRSNRSMATSAIER
ncbi:MAG: isoaspartyl peptidase/L-asparaginase [Burkholderiaceae bacterium]|jgi:L-asparaginase/beta-aspartyl-peptidase (threonine type)|nr:isoaspartyl peptidase/L-asparaginase [Burkholderiaceae bacterium]